MRLRILRTIYFKEIREALRDRRTLFMMVGLPLILYPAILTLMSRLQESQQAEQAARTSRVAVWGALPAPLEKQMREQGRIELLPWASAPASVRADLEAGRLAAPPPELPKREADNETPEETKISGAAWARAAQSALLERKADAILLLWPGFTQHLDQGGLGATTILYDSVRPESIHARSRLQDEFKLYRRALLEQRERDKGLGAGFTTGVDLHLQNVATSTRRSGMMLGMLLPYMLIIFSLLSGFYASIDMTAGEKERGTMQTLLCAPVQAIEIIGGKFLAVWSISLLATTVNLISLGLTFSRVRLLPGTVAQLPLSSYLVAFLLVLPVTMTVNAIFLAVGAYARDFKDGQNYLTPLLFALIIPLVATMAPGMELNGYLAFAPIVNIALLIKSVFLGEWHADMLFLVLTSSVCYAALALVFAASVFERNNVLLGGKEGFSSVLSFRRTPGDAPTPGVSILLFALSLVLAFYGSLAIAGRSIVAAFLIVELGFFLLPALGFSAAKGYDWTGTFALRGIPWKGLLAAVLIGASGWTFAAGVFIRLLPPPPSLLKAMERILLLRDTHAPVWEVLLLVALLPAVCEEIFFRGLVMSGFRRLGAWPAILATGLLFGLAHSSIYRLLPTLFLGVVFGYAVWKTRSIAAGMICHALNNGLMILLSRSKGLAAQLGLSQAKFLPWNVVIGGAVVLVLGLLLLRSLRPPESSPEHSPPGGY